MTKMIADNDDNNNNNNQRSGHVIANTLEYLMTCY